MKWDRLVKQRQQELLFDKDEIISKEQISNVLHLMHREMPSKQGEYPFHIDVLDWSNVSLRKYLIKNTLASDGRMNTQMLAPILFCFSEIENEYFSRMEIGIASLFLSFALKDIGLNSGFCGCVQNNNKIASKLKRNNSTTVLFLGVGKTVEELREVTDMVTGETYKTGPNRNERKRSFRDIVQFHF